MILVHYVAILRNMAKYLPFDITVFDEPCLTRLSPFQFGLLTNLVLDYWRCGVPLPEADNELARLSKTNLGLWYKHKDKVVPAFEAVMPCLVKLREKKGTTYRKLKINAHNSAIKRKTGRWNKVNLLSDRKTIRATINAAAEAAPNEWKPGKYDHVTRQKAIENNKKDDGKLLSDD